MKNWWLLVSEHLRRNLCEIFQISNADEVNMNRLRAIRLERNLSQYELSEATGGSVPRWKLQLVELGYRSLAPNERESVAAALGVSIEYLFPPSAELANLSNAALRGNDAS